MDLCSNPSHSISITFGPVASHARTVGQAVQQMADTSRPVSGCAAPGKKLVCLWSRKSPAKLNRLCLANDVEEIFRKRLLQKYTRLYTNPSREAGVGFPVLKVRNFYSE